jgi:hypothetical protein
VDITDTFPNGQIVQTTAVSQQFNHFASSSQFTSAVNNRVKAKDTLNFITGVNSNASSSQQYNFADSPGQIYGCNIAAKDNILKSVTPGCNQTITFK